MVEDNLHAREENARGESGQLLHGVQKHLEPLPKFTQILNSTRGRTPPRITQSPTYITIESD